MAIVIRAAFLNDKKYYPQVFLYECLYEIWKCRVKKKLIRDIKNRACYYLHDMIKNVDINFSNILLDEKLFENFQSMTFYTKPQQVQNHCLLG